MTRSNLPFGVMFNDVEGQPSTFPATTMSELSVVSSLSAVQEVSDSTLAELVQQLNQKKHLVDAELLLYLSEFDFRKLYREAACSSFFEYLTTRLGYSEDVAYRRMWCARLLREYPVIHEYLRSGQIHMAALLLLKPLFTQDNHRELLRAAVGKSKREVEKLVAARNPQPDALTRIRRLPEPGTAPCATLDGARANASLDEAPANASLDEAPANASLDEARPNASLDGARPNASLDGARPNASLDGARPNASLDGARPNASLDGARPNALSSIAARDSESYVKVGDPMVSRGGSRAPSIVPSSASSYRVVFTASERLKQKLDRAAALTSHRNHPSDLPSLLEHALDLLIAREECRRFGAKGSRRQDGDPGRNDSVIQPDTAPSEMTLSRKLQLQANRSETTQPSTMQLQANQSAQRGAVRPYAIPTQKTQPLAVDPLDTQSETTHPVTSGALVPGARGSSSRGSVYIPAAVRREVWERDGEQCTYVNARGERCQSRHFLQFDHRIAQALGGPSTVENLRLRCAAHNALAAEQVLGVRRVRTAMAEAEQRRRHGREGKAKEA
ncbi:MAG: hypothetical protein QM784_10015 [Polyangiaceae bacterium]